jgi:arsenate reductase
LKILYICTHNRCRSILSEAITNHLSNGKIVAKSAGSQPAGQVHPLSIKYLQQAGIKTDNLISQSWNDLEGFAPDIVITVCDSAAGEACPLWLGASVKVHWGLADPSKMIGSEDEVEQAFKACIDENITRVKQLLSLQIESYDKQALREILLTLGAS